jgi:nucleotide-binding universal stress UspA family protein
MINKILVATDASAASGRAVSFAAQLAVIHEAELLILNVIRDMQLPDELKNAPEFESFNNTRDDLMRQAADRILDEARKKAKKAGAKKVQTAIGRSLSARVACRRSRLPRWAACRASCWT